MIMKIRPNLIVQLIHIHGGLKGQIQEFSASLITIGRLPSLTLHFPPDEPGVSREHARIERDGNHFKLSALKDKFGTFVNGRPVREALLQKGDVIEFGLGGPKVSFNVQLDQTAATQLPGPEPGPPAGSASGRPSAWPRFEAPDSSLPASGPGWPGEVQGSEPPERASGTLVIQFGPTVRIFQELPVSIGAHAQCDFVLKHSGIRDQQVQILFSRGSYFVKDLTGERLVSVNGRPADSSVPLIRLDEISCGMRGPVFRFLGEGRLAELEAYLSEERFATSTQDTNPGPGPQGRSQSTSVLSRLLKGLK
jgi:predicted component of type VI protein secretion system